MFGDEMISLHLLDKPTLSDELLDVATDITDTASPLVVNVQCTSSQQVRYICVHTFTHTCGMTMYMYCISTGGISIGVCCVYSGLSGEEWEGREGDEGGR